MNFTWMEIYIIAGLTCAMYSTYEDGRALLTDWVDPTWNDKALEKINEQRKQIHTLGAALPKSLLAAIYVVAFAACAVVNVYVWPYWVYKFFSRRIK